MSTFDPRIPTLTWLTIETTLFLAVIVLALRRRAGQEAAAYLLSLYAGIALALQGSETAWRAGLLNVSDPVVFIQLHWYGALSLAFLLVLILRAFLRMGGSEGWVATGVFWLIALMLLADNAFDLPNIVWSGGNWVLPREQLNFGAAGLGWAVFTIGGVVTARRAYKNMRQPLHRNRLIYWLPIYLLSITADMLFFSEQVVWGQALRLVSVWLLVYVVVTHHLPDVRRIMRSTLIYVSTTLLVVLFYVAGFTFSQYAFQAAPG
ncbi:MAG: hypothetical protein GXP40_08800, partial [Chloroflexi bacterium]|nr:hypothetical protein [Chloroflexota bacterium]